ncbi:MAG: carboxylating nicotinate-nucleotide diphosphorylase [Bacteroidetes bacterium]|nr:carboxylating nicotinate-nucleotide diphosphorylase [Bacteroidota bacterium]
MVDQQDLYTLLDAAFLEDIGEGDHSTLACIPATERGRAVLKIKDKGVLAGVEIARQIFLYKDPTALFTPHMQDGELMQQGQLAFTIESYMATILQCERVMLNCMQRMSGIATLTRQYVDAIKGYSTQLLDTRKTTPNFRLLEKEAVKIGGGKNHRFGLYDMLMLKDNHIDFCGGLQKAIQLAWNYAQEVNPSLKIEVEARSLDDVKEIVLNAKGKVFRIMLDNFTPPALAEAVALIKKEGGFETEASGGINLQNICEYAASGVDFISVGALIHQARSLDLSLKAIKV